MTKIAARAIVHLEKNQPSVEGLICKHRGRMIIAGHYVVRDAKVLQGADGGQITGAAVEGELHIPAERVVYVQVLG